MTTQSQKSVALMLPEADTMRVASVQSQNRWGWLPILSLSYAIGVFLVAMAYEAGRIAAPWYEAPFWLGMIVLFLPTAYRLLLSHPTREERIALVTLLGVSFYLAQFLEYPLYLAGHDSFAHWRTAQDITAGGHLFQHNPLLPISALYPGQEIINNALTSLTGLPVFWAGFLEIGVAETIFVLSLYLLYERLSALPRTASLAALLYMANSAFMFFDTQFSYESLALPLAAFVLYTMSMQRYAPTYRSRSLTLLTIGGLAVVSVTHPVTSYILDICLLGWTIIHTLQRRSQREAGSPTGIAFIALGLSIAWVFYTKGVVINYLLPHFNSTLQQIILILSGHNPPRQLFHAGSSYVTPLWERILAIGSLVLLVAGLPFGLLQIKRRYRTSALTLVLACAALSYPISQAFRLTSAGAESAVRTTEFLFLGLAFVLAVSITERWVIKVQSRRSFALMLSALTIIFLGQVVLGSEPAWASFPGPYLVSADQRSIEPEGITTAEWARIHLGTGNRVAADRINTLLMATYGYQRAFTSVGAPLPVEPIFVARSLNAGVMNIMRTDHIQYVVVDLRLSTSLPWVGTYFDDSPTKNPVTKPLSLAVLTKFDHVQYVNRVFDSGDIVIYDVRPLTG